MMDYHTHSYFSGDSEASMESMCQSALEKGLDEICFTEHLDIGYPAEDTNFTIDFSSYEQRILEMKLAYPSLTIKKGIEIGYQSQYLVETMEAIRSESFDFVISSLHIVDGQDPYFISYFEGKSKEQAYGRYLEEVLDSVKTFQDYNVIGHIGYVAKGAPYEDVTLHYRDFPDILDTILKEIIQSNHGIEINTSGYRYGSSPIPDFSIIKRYKELGGEIITLGSDAHVPEYVSYCFHDVLSLLKEAGFSYLTCFDKRKPSFVRIP